MKVEIIKGPLFERVTQNGQRLLYEIAKRKVLNGEYKRDQKIS